MLDSLWARLKTHWVKYIFDTAFQMAVNFLERELKTTAEINVGSTRWLRPHVEHDDDDKQAALANKGFHDTEQHLKSEKQRYIES